MKIKAALHMFVLIIFLAGCISTHVKPDTTERQAETKQVFATYVACLNERAELYAPTANAQSDIADATLYDCGRQLQEYREAVKRYLDVSIGQDNELKFMRCVAKRSHCINWC